MSRIGVSVGGQALSSDMRVMFARRMRFAALPIPVNHRRTTKRRVTHNPCGLMTQPRCTNGFLTETVPKRAHDTRVIGDEPVAHTTNGHYYG